MMSRAAAVAPETSSQTEPQSLNVRPNREALTMRGGMKLQPFNGQSQLFNPVQDAVFQA